MHTTKPLTSYIELWRQEGHITEAVTLTPSPLDDTVQIKEEVIDPAEHVKDEVMEQCEPPPASSSTQEQVSLLAFLGPTLPLAINSF